MKIFLDANILVTVFCNEYPGFTFCSRILSLCDNRQFEVYTSPVCLAIAFYFSEKKNGASMAKSKIALLSEKIKVAAMDESVVHHAGRDKRVKDFEDGLEYYSAVQAKCDCIVTYDVSDFYFSSMAVLPPEEFLLRHVAGKRGR